MLYTMTELVLIIYVLLYKNLKIFEILLIVHKKPSSKNQRFD